MNDYKKLCNIDTADQVSAEILNEFENGLKDAWEHYVNCDAKTVDALEDNSMEAAFAKGFAAGCIFEQNKILKEFRR